MLIVEIQGLNHMDKEEAKKAIQELATRFTSRLSEYESSGYLESQLRAGNKITAIIINNLLVIKLTFISNFLQ